MSSSTGFVDVGGSGSGGGVTVGMISFCRVPHRVARSGWSSLSVQGSMSERSLELGPSAGGSGAKLDEPLIEGVDIAATGVLRVRTGDVDEI